MKNQIKNKLFKTLLLLFIIFSAENLNAQNDCVDWDWAISNPDLVGYRKTSFRSHILDASGNSYVTGRIYDSLKFGSIKIINSGGGGSSSYLAKLDNKGEWKWAISLSNLLGLPGYLFTYDIAYEESGHIYLATINSTDIIVAKIDSTGKVKWVANAATRSSPNNVSNDAITMDAYGNLYITGHYENEAIFGSATLSKNGSNTYIAKLDSSGKWKWAANVNGFAYGKSIITDNFGNVALLTYHDTYINNTPTSNILVNKIDSSGQRKIEKTIVSSIKKNFLGAHFSKYSISSDNLGNIIVTGSFSDTIQSNGIQLSTSSQSDLDIFVVKIDSSGQFEWITSAGGKYEDIGNSLVTNSAGDIFVSGIISDSVIFGNYKLVTTGKTDLFIAKLSSNGNWQWIEKIGGTNNSDIVHSSNIKSDSSGNLYLSGTFTGKLNFGNTLSISSLRQHESFFAKLKGELKVSGGKNLDISCGDNVKLEASGSGFTTVEWSPKTGLDNPNILNPIASPNTTTTYTITAKNLCGDSVTSQVTVSIIQNAKITGDTLSCPTSINNYKANTDSNITYTWSVTGGTIQSGQGTENVSVLWNAVGNGSVKLIKTNSAGCKDSAFLSVKVDSSNCNWVWPGDADYNKIVDNQDVLKIGLAYNDTGAARRNASSTWTAQLADDWSKNFSNGINYKHADCNGDGIIDSTDILVINSNYGQRWNKKGASQAPAGPDDANLVLQFSKDSFQAGDIVHIALQLGSATIPAKDVYGLAFSFTFDPEIIEAGSVKLDLSNSWLRGASSVKKLISLTKEFSDKGYADIAISRTDKNNASGSGTIGTLSFVLKKDMGGSGAASKLLKSEIMDLLAISANEDTIPLNAVGGSVVVYQEKVGIREVVMNTDNIRIYPNPSDGNFVLDLDDLHAQKVQVINLLGQEVWRSNDLKGRTEINLDAEKAGLYFINIQTAKGVVTKRMVISR